MCSVTAQNNVTVNNDGTVTAGDVEAGDKAVAIDMYKCFYTDCILPPDANTDPPARSRQSYVVQWSDADIWQEYDPEFPNVFMANQSEDPGIPVTTVGVPTAIMDGDEVITDIVIAEGALACLVII